VFNLQYADDTLVFINNDVEQPQNLKWLLVLFEQISGIRINFNKSDLIPINVNSEECNVLAQVIGCKSFPSNTWAYLCILGKSERRISNQLLMQFLRELQVGEVDCYHMSVGW
jgi:hypothetical protein